MGMMDLLLNAQTETEFFIHLTGLIRHSNHDGFQAMLSHVDTSGVDQNHTIIIIWCADSAARNGRLTMRLCSPCSSNCSNNMVS